MYHYLLMNGLVFLSPVRGTILVMDITDMIMVQDTVESAFIIRIHTPVWVDVQSARFAITECVVVDMDMRKDMEGVGIVVIVLSEGQ